MIRLTTDTPNGTYMENLLNLAYAKDREVWLRLNPDVRLCEYTAAACACYSCPNITPEDVMESGLLDCDGCPIAIMYTLAIQAAELRTCLKQYEDTGLTPEEVAALADPWISTAENPPKVGEPVMIARPDECGKPLRVEEGIRLPDGKYKAFGNFLKVVFKREMPTEDGWYWVTTDLYDDALGITIFPCFYRVKHGLFYTFNPGYYGKVAEFQIMAVAGVIAVAKMDIPEYKEATP